MRLFAIFGAGGFGREVMPVARETILSTYGSEGNKLVFVVENLEKSSVINGHEVISDEDFLAYQVDEKYFNIAIAEYRARERIVGKLTAAGIKPFTIRSQNSVVFDENAIGEGAILCPFTTITSNVKIGKSFHLNLYSYVTHDCVIGDFVTFAARVNCNGRVIIEDYAYIGTGAIIRPGSDSRPIVIGKGSVIGMGAVVTKSVPPFTTVVGNPAAELKRK